MKRSTRYFAIYLLAGLVQFFLPGALWAENLRWDFVSNIDPLTDKSTGLAHSVHSEGGRISFVCRPGEPIAKFLVIATTKKFDVNSDGQIEVAWRIDSGAVRNEVWPANTYTDGGGVLNLGQDAYEFALAISRAQERIVFRDGNGTVVYDAKGSTNAIQRLLDFCGLKK